MRARVIQPNRCSNSAVFLDRDGVLIEDVDLLTRREEIRILPGVPRALKALRSSQLRLFVVTNQAVVARGLATLQQVREINRYLGELLATAGAPRLEGFYFCPHHPNANILRYRVACECRKPKSGLLQAAAREHGIELQSSFMVGDRMTDLMAGANVGCRTVLVETGKHHEPLIETSEPKISPVKPDFVCADLSAAAEWILTVK